MTEVSIDDIRGALRGWKPDFFPRQLEIADAVSLNDQEAKGLSLTVRLGYPSRRCGDGARRAICRRLRQHFPRVGKIDIELKGRVTAGAVQRSLTVTGQVRNVIAVGSGKGGVGKSTVASNLALALLAEGASVGLLDADIYGPSQPIMLGVRQAPESEDGKKMIPVKVHGLQLISVGFLIDADTPMIWRGPMASSALRQLFEDCLWEDLDYLVVDLPPGTGDIQLTLAQRIPTTGAIVVSTPQKVAIADARKSIKMFEKVSVPVLGVVENMSAFHCPECGKETPLFGARGCEQLARETGVDLLGSIPLTLSTRECGDEGLPEVAARPDSPGAQAFFSFAHRVMVALCGRPRDYTQKFGRIQVQTTDEKPEISA